MQQIVMSEEFETLDKALMVDVIRRRQVPPPRPQSEPHYHELYGRF